MGHKKLCLDCRKIFNREFDGDSGHVYLCPDCGQAMILMPHRFRPPRRPDHKKWETVRFLIENGFKYQPIYNYIATGETLLSERVGYPENLRDAQEFVTKHSAQACKNKI